MTVTFTTAHPDAPQPSVDAVSRTELAASWADFSNYGDYKVEYREAGGAWQDATTVGHETTAADIAGLEEHTEYEVRLRSTTEHGSGAWSPAGTAITPTDLAMPASTVSLSTPEPDVEPTSPAPVEAPTSTVSLSSPTPDLGYEAWSIDGTPVPGLTSETRTWQDLELAFRAPAARRNNDLRPLDSRAGSVDVITDSNGEFRSMDRAGGANTYGLVPPISRDPPRTPRDYRVDDYSDEMLDQRGADFRVSLTLVADESRTDSNGLAESRSDGEWLFELPRATVATARVGQAVATGSKDGEATKSVELVLDAGQTEAVESSLTALEAVTVHEVPDGENFAVDESPGSLSTVSVTAPAGGDDILPSGEYAAVEWESEWRSEDSYLVSLELVETAQN